MIKIILRQIITISLSFLITINVAAQLIYPKGPVKIVVPYPAGGAADITTRIFAQRLTELIGQPFIVDNKPGGGTNIAAAIVARSLPDGYTLFVDNFATHGVNKWLYKELPFDPDKDFVAAALMVQGPMFLIVNPLLQVSSVQDLINLAKTKPGKLTYGSVGIGSPNHIVAELFRMHTNINVVHVPYKGSVEANRDLLAGQIDFVFDATAMSLVRAGKLKALAIAHTKRWPSEANIPSMAELGFPGVSVSTFFALVAPTNTPIFILDKLNDAARTIAKEPEVISKLMQIGLIPSTANQKEVVDFLNEQSTKWKPILEASGAKVD